MEVRQLRVGPMANFVYLVMDLETRKALVVDSGWETGPITRAAEELGAKVEFVVATHEHFDHTSTLRDTAEAFGAKVVAHVDSPIDCDLRVEGGKKLKLGGRAMEILHTPGHTADSICLYDGKEVFTGDLLFVGTIGRFAKEDAPDMFRSLHETVLRLPPGTVVYPGHDYGEVPSRTLGEEARLNPFLMAGDLRTFVSLFS
jgi:hydroxyacylglutathione hydrolase